MKKILLAFDGSHFSEGAFEFVRGLNELQRILLVGVFVPQIDYANLWSYASAAGAPTYIPLLEDENSQAVQANIERFERLCTENNIEYSVHKDFLDFAIPELRKETRFADLLVLSGETFYCNAGTGEPNEYLKEVIQSAECPVLVVPEEYEFPKSNILSFDGSDSSVFAIKQFAYLFPELCANETFLIYANDADKTVPGKELIGELAALHFSNLTVLKVTIDPRKYFATWLADRGPVLLVSGAFGRSFISELFKKSFVSEVIADHRVPVFIAHR